MSRLLFFACAAFFFTATVKSGSVPEELVDAVPFVREVCLNETGVEEELVEQAILGNFADDPKLKCYIKCGFELFGMLTAKGTINYREMRECLPQSMRADLLPVLDACVVQPGEDACERAFNFQKCFYEKNPKLYFLL